MPQIEKIPFGLTGHRSTRTLFGAAALGRVTQKAANETLEVLLKYGVNHLATAARFLAGMEGELARKTLYLRAMRHFSTVLTWCVLILLLLGFAGSATAKDFPAWRTFSTTQNHASQADVKAIQFLLRGRGLYSSQPDGIYGPQTASAVKAFQRKRGLIVDGIVGPQTWPHLIVTLKRGARGDFVRAAQTLLRHMTGHSLQIAYPDLKVDGIFGAETEAATLDAQKYQNWFEKRGPENGIFGSTLWRALSQKQ